MVLLEVWSGQDWVEFGGGLLVLVLSGVGYFGASWRVRAWK